LYSAVPTSCLLQKGLPSEAISGYYNRPWQWDTIRGNAQWILQLGSSDDPLVPIAEQRYVAEHLKPEYIEYHDQGHFLIGEFPELVQMIKQRVAKQQSDQSPASS
jgi:pimeloyl-ACP methyl ester carboxylesterase